jgi:hypothetical protein
MSRAAQRAAAARGAGSEQSAPPASSSPASGETRRPSSSRELASTTQLAEAATGTSDDRLETLDDGRRATAEGECLGGALPPAWRQHARRRSAGCLRSRAQGNQDAPLPPTPSRGSDRQPENCTEVRRAPVLGRVLREGWLQGRELRELRREAPRGDRERSASAMSRSSRSLRRRRRPRCPANRTQSFRSGPATRRRSLPRPKPPLPKYVRPPRVSKSCSPGHVPRRRAARRNTSIAGAIGQGHPRSRRGALARARACSKAVHAK